MSLVKENTRFQPETFAFKVQLGGRVYTFDYQTCLRYGKYWFEVYSNYVVKILKLKLQVETFACA